MLPLQQPTEPSVIIEREVEDRMSTDSCIYCSCLLIVGGDADREERKK